MKIDTQISEWNRKSRNRPIYIWKIGILKRQPSEITEAMMDFLRNGVGTPMSIQ